MKDELEFSEIGIIRQALEQAKKQKNINYETEEACEILIAKLEKLNEVFNWADEYNRYIWQK